MPIYEYRCEKGHTFEVLQKMSDDPLASCSSCSAPAQRVFHPIAVHFKGKGFYNTDYGTRSRQREQAAAAEGSSEGSAKKSEDAKSGASSEASSPPKSDGPAEKANAGKTDSKAS